MEVITKHQAKLQGLKRFFTGVPCARGHVVERSTSSGSCLTCQTVYNKKTVLKNGRPPRGDEQKAKAAEYSKKYHQRNREECLQKMKARNEIYYQKNKERIKKQVLAYAKGNQNMTNYKREWQKDRLANDPEFRMTWVMRRMLHRCLGVAGQKKYKNTRDYLPYSSKDLVNHLESLFVSGMSLSNYGEWHIDHIRPISNFVKVGNFDPAQINALTNLRPLWAKENMKKGSSFSPPVSGL